MQQNDVTDDLSGGGYLVPHWYAYGGTHDVARRGLAGWLWRALAIVCYKLGCSGAGYRMRQCGVESAHFPGIVNLIAGNRELIECEGDK